jgi:hypothetical protein
MEDLEIWPDDQCKRSSAQNQAISPFLQLPLEVRNYVYGFVFQEQHWCLSSFETGSLKWKPSELTLIYVSRRVYLETALLPFGLSTFHFSLGHRSDDRATVRTTLDRKAEPRNLQSLCINYCAPLVRYSLVHFKHLDAFPRLRTLQFRFNGYNPVITIEGD